MQLHPSSPIALSATSGASLADHDGPFEVPGLPHSSGSADFFAITAHRQPIKSVATTGSTPKRVVGSSRG